ncbi:hypothetical protein [Dermatobacter hominis]|uniref:hypothetical protein n=1 Tax=Dermatobacter hominis TaxID=2884263 RepID=UPI001D10C079|nr:hypothetical protein [Dermatobacter hominis]UDY33962.1 hypothetical protein LH044_11450 [Dermatobacter hominis]
MSRTDADGALTAGDQTSAGAAYEAAGHAVVRGLVDPALVDHLVAYADVLRGRGSFEIDDQVPGSLRTYGAAGFDALLPTLATRLSDRVGRTLLPTYSFARIYARGQELFPHRDRVECEHSVTLHLAGADDAPWPIWLRDGDADPVGIDLAPGDGLLYRGDRVLHWRDPLDAEWYLQVFLHFVDADGPYADRAYDGRAGLGTSSSLHTGAEQLGRP